MDVAEAASLRILLYLSQPLLLRQPLIMIREIGWGARPYNYNIGKFESYGIYHKAIVRARARMCTTSTRNVGLSPAA